MKNREKRYLIVSVLLLVATGFVFADTCLTENAAPIDLEKLPLHIGAWQGQAFPVEERIKNILQTDFILSRDYTSQKRRHVFLSIVYYPDNKIGFHNPESCNAGAGSRLIRKDIKSLKVGKSFAPSGDFRVNRLLMERAKGNKIILYFFVSGDYMTCDYLKFRLYMMKQQMGFRRPSGAQIQIHSNIDSDSEITISVMEDFIRALLPLLPGYLS